MSKVNNLKEFLEARGCGEVSVAQVKRSTYKYTSCGAWLETDKEGVSVGSIVEGVDQGTETYQLNYPFEIKDFWNSLDAVEQEAKEIWNSTHGCEDCDPEMDSEQGYAAINPKCKTCEGEGMII
jgi:hypothetical protein